MLPRTRATKTLTCTAFASSSGSVCYLKHTKHVAARAWREGATADSTLHYQTSNVASAVLGLRGNTGMVFYAQHH
jgi:hypothetical protein